MIGLGSIVVAAALAIAMLAGVVRGLVVDHRWMMYSLFIGLTLGGVPVVWGLLRKVTTDAAAAGAMGIAVMAAMALVQPGEAADGQGGIGAYLILFVAGVAGSSAMILPGVSGGYLLLILGQYLTILGAIDQAKTAFLQAGGPDWAVLFNAFHVFIPVGLGVLVGAVGVSNLMRFFLARYEKATLGFLMGLLLGAVLGLWPFQQTVPPDPGDVIRGQVMTVETIATLDPKYYPMERFPPSGGQLAGAAGLVALGWLVTYGVALVGRER
jgi:putative membrane protein